MNSKQLLLLILLGLVLGGAGLLVRRNQQSQYSDSSSTMGGTLLGAFDVNSVAGFRITVGTNPPTEILKRENDWIIPGRGGYPANFPTVGEFLKKLAELKIASPVRVGPSRLPMLELTRETATTLELLDAAGKPIKAILLGRKHVKEGADNSQFGHGSFPTGRYVKVGDAIALVGDAVSTADSRLADWIDKDFFKIEKPKSVVVQGRSPTNTFSLMRENEFGEWKLADAKSDENIDPTKLSSYSSLLSSPTFNDVVTDPKPVELGLDQPTVVTIGTTDGFTYKLTLGKPQADDAIPLQVAVEGEFNTTRTLSKDEKPEDKDKLDKEFQAKLGKLQEKLKAEKSYGKWTYLVSKYTVDALLKDRTGFQADKKPESKPGDHPPLGVPSLEIPTLDPDDK
ncbi:MAG: DUF4340 domain-containing protein [Pedosphaera sp.]|nr:DUF4340 domain-containing protein [Pedosphaera sp.]